MEEENFFHINKKLIPAKLHYLFMFGGYGGVSPFSTLLGKGLGISATAVGFSNTTLMGFTLLSKPFMGSLVDYFRSIRFFLILLILLNAFSSLSLLLLPPIERKPQEPIHLRLRISNNSQDFIPLPFSFNNACIKEIAGDSEISCYAVLFKNTSRSINYEEKANETNYLQDFQTSNLTDFNNNNNTMNATFSMYVSLNNPENISMSDLDQSKLLHVKCEPEINSCKFQDEGLVNEYETYQFWAFACLLIIAGLALGNAVSLSDVACYEVLGEKRHLYGRQRLFGTVGWALACLLSGYLSDLATGNKINKDYSPGYYVMACLLLIDIFILFKMPPVKVKLSTDIYRDVKKVFHSNEIILFAIGAILIGSFAAIISYYELWYLQDLGASQSLLGWAIIVQCLIAEAPFFIISGWFVKKFGSFNCLIGSFSAYALRFGCYSIITNPWWALLIDTTHGFTFAMFHAAMTNFVSVKAPDGVEGTMFGIFGGLIDGMGQASGSLLCGAAFDKFGGRLTFTMASIFSGTCALVFIILSRLLNKCSDRTRKNDISLEKQTP
ncbi:Major facilitator superfamily like protein [Argiope bruennichi]|uniref:Major facilitator superfamily like protein n=1 Tax=Argiope bruennichi TaxID=94029 RepID=A0A8T0EI84_ARGBR|nr:Major facilitator superfamily like protein [Argiope bruennichi]